MHIADAIAVFVEVKKELSGPMDIVRKEHIQRMSDDMTGLAACPAKYAAVEHLSRMITEAKAQIMRAETVVRENIRGVLDDFRHLIPVELDEALKTTLLTDNGDQLVGKYEKYLQDAFGSLLAVSSDDDAALRECLEVIVATAPGMLLQDHADASNRSDNFAGAVTEMHRALEQQAGTEFAAPFICVINAIIIRATLASVPQLQEMRSTPSAEIIEGIRAIRTEPLDDIIRTGLKEMIVELGLDEPEPELNA